MGGIKLKVISLIMQGIKKVNKFIKLCLNKFKTPNRKQKLLALTALFVLTSASVFILINNKTSNNSYLNTGDVVFDAQDSEGNTLSEDTVFDDSEIITLLIESGHNANSIDLGLLKSSIIFEPKIDFKLYISEMEFNKVFIKPGTNWNKNTFFKMAINVGQVITNDKAKTAPTSPWIFFVSGNTPNRISDQSYVFVKNKFDTNDITYDVHLPNITSYPNSGDPNLRLRIYKSSKSYFFSHLNFLIEELKNTPYIRLQEYNLEKENEYIWETQISNSAPVYGWGLRIDQKITPPNLNEGVYILTLEDARGGILISHFYFVNTMIIHTVKAEKSSVFFVQNMNTGAKVSFQTLSLRSFNNQVESSIQTDKDGKSITNLLFDMVYTENNEELVINSNNNTILKVDYNGYYDISQDKNRYVILTDREIYKPGDLVNFKVISRKLSANGVVFGDSDIEMNLRLGYFSKEGDSKFINLSDTLSTNITGSIDGSFIIPKDLLTNTVDIKLYQGDTYITSDSIILSDLSKPAYSVSINTDKSIYFNGDTIKVEITAKTFSGFPAQNTKIKLLMDLNYNGTFKNPCSSNSSYYIYDTNRIIEGVTFANYGVLSYPSQSDDFLEEEIILDVNGTAKLDIPINSKEQLTETTITIKAYVADDSEGLSSTIKSLKYYSSRVFLDIPYNFFQLQSKRLLKYLDSNCNPKSGAEVGVTIDGVSLKAITDINGYGEFDFSNQNDYTNTIVFDVEGRITQSINRALYRSYSEPNYVTIEFDDKEIYNVGEQINYTIKANGRSGDILVTTYTRSFSDIKVIHLDNEINLSIPVIESSFPEIIFTAVYYDNSQLVTFRKWFDVSNHLKKLNVTVTPTKNIFEPGELYRAKIKVVDAENRPIQTELTISCFDKSILDLLGYNEYYYDGSYDADYLLRFFNYFRGPSMFSSVYGLDLNPVGGSGAGGPPDLDVRKNFKDTAFWNSSVSTDSNGEAILEFQLPDNLTQWHFKIWAYGGSDKFGFVELDQTVSKDLAIFTNLPKTVFLGDHILLNTKIVNGSKDSQNIKVSLETGNGLVIEGTTSQIITLPANTEQEELLWDITATEINENAYVKVYAQGNIDDSISLNVDIKPNGFYHTNSIYLSNTTEKSYEIYNDAEKPRASITIFPSIKSILDKVTNIDFNKKYYTFNSYLEFLSNDAIAGSLVAKKIRSNYFGEFSKADFDAGIAKLIGNQQPDGGFSWYRRYSTTDPLTGALTLYYYSILNNNSFYQNDNFKNKLVNFVLNSYNDPYYSNYKQLFVIALSSVGYDTSSLINEFENTNDTNKLLMAIAYEYLGNRSKAHNLLREIENRFISNENLLYFDIDDYNNIFYCGSSYQNNIWLFNLYSLQGDMAKAEKVLNYLIQQPQFGNTYNLFSNITFSNSIQKIIENTGTDFSVFGTVKFYNNENLIKEVSLDDSNSGLINFGVDNLVRGTNILKIEKNVDGKFFAKLNIEQYSLTKVVNTIEDANISKYYTDFSGNKIQNFNTGDIIFMVTEFDTPRELAHTKLKTFVPAGFEYISPYNYIFKNRRWDNDTLLADSIFLGNEVEIFVQNFDKRSKVIVPLKVKTKGVFNSNPSAIYLNYMPEFHLELETSDVQISN